MAITRGTSPRRRFKMFTRTWWKLNASWPDGREPSMGPKHTLGYADSEEEAIRFCREWNGANKPGKLSKKCEYEESFR